MCVVFARLNFPVVAATFLIVATVGMINLPNVLPPAAASDWPQILGPGRDGVAVQETLHEEWPADGPRVLWKASVGGGFSGIAVAGERAVAFVREADQEIVRCYDAATGKVQWESATECFYQGGVSEDKGPRCVPLISSDRIYTLGVQGLLRCLSLTDGNELWKRDTTRDFKPLEGYFGVGSTPVLYKDRLIVNVGGREQASIVAFSTEDGSTVWKSFQDNASYSSPVIATFDGADTAIVVTRLNVAGLNPQTGEVLFSVPFGARGPTVNGATPVVTGSQIFLSASYNIGSLLLKVSGGKATEVWRNEELLATQYATAVPLKPGSNVLFAVDGRQDAGRSSSQLKCLDISSQKVLWAEDGFDYGSLIRVNDELLFLTCGGELIRAGASPTGYREISRATVLNPMDRGYRLPALSNGRLFVRDEDTLKCLEVGPTK